MSTKKKKFRTKKRGLTTLPDPTFPVGNNNVIFTRINKKLINRSSEAQNYLLVGTFRRRKTRGLTARTRVALPVRNLHYTSPVPVLTSVWEFFGVPKSRLSTKVTCHSFLIRNAENSGIRQGSQDRNLFFLVYILLLRRIFC